MPKYTSQKQGFRSRIPHWVCTTCATVFTKQKPGKCSHCNNADGYYYFPSRKEYSRYAELKLLEQSGHIDPGSLELQPAYKVTVEHRVVFDFRYTVHGREVIEDVKTSGTNTNQSKSRRKAAEEQHGIKVELV